MLDPDSWCPMPISPAPLPGYTRPLGLVPNGPWLHRVRASNQSEWGRGNLANVDDTYGISTTISNNNNSGTTTSKRRTGTEEFWVLVCAIHVISNSMSKGEANSAFLMNWPPKSRPTERNLTMANRNRKRRRESAAEQHENRVEWGLFQLICCSDSGCTYIHTYVHTYILLLSEGYTRSWESFQNELVASAHPTCMWSTG